MDRLEEIHYNISIISGAYIADDPQILIAKTILRLPADIQEKVLDQVTFIATNGVYGQYERLKAPPKKRVFHFILLNLSEVESEEEKQYIIAHEIAHFVLDHCVKDDPKKEEQADNQCKIWGFTVPEYRKDHY